MKKIKMILSVPVKLVAYWMICLLSPIDLSFLEEAIHRKKSKLANKMIDCLPEPYKAVYGVYEKVMGLLGDDGSQAYHSLTVPVMGSDLEDLLRTAEDRANIVVGLWSKFVSVRVNEVEHQKSEHPRDEEGDVYRIFVQLELS